MEKVRSRKDRELIICGHCGKGLQKDNLAYHTKSKHPGEKPRIKGDPLTLGHFLSLKSADQASGSSQSRSKCDKQQSNVSVNFIMKLDNYLPIKINSFLPMICVIKKMHM
jgi:hypothetical protein